jgi:putative tryptophan/tyrosine transport system substrate-binding protein
MIQRRVAVMVVGPGPGSQDVIKGRPPTTPVVFMSASDPVRQGLVTSLNRPGGNLTGVSIIAGDLNAKRFGLFHDLAPKAPVIGVLWNGIPNPTSIALQEVQTAASTLGVPIRIVTAATEGEIEPAFATLAQNGVNAMFVVNTFLFYSLSDRLAALALRYRMALSGELRVFVEFGGLTYYGPNELEMFRQTGRYTGRILKGEKAGDLPVMLPARFEFVVNLKTAKTIGLDIPPDILSAADEVIE